MRLPSLFKHNAARVGSRLRELDLGAAILLSPPNFTYATGAILTAQRDIPERLAIAVVDQVGHVRTVICSIDDTPFRRESWVEDISLYVEGEASPAQCLAEVIIQMGLEHERLGIESSSMSLDVYRALRHSMPEVCTVSFDQEIGYLRAEKSDLELGVIAEGCRITELALYEGVNRFRLGETEARLALHIQDALESMGGRTQLINVVSGELTVVPNALARARVIDRGALIKVDLTGLFDGYLSDMARVFFAGAADAAQLDRYQRYVAIYREILGSVRAGTRAGDVYAHAVLAHETNGMDFVAPHVGHGIGIALHDLPLLCRNSDDRLAENMAVAVEPRSLVAAGERIHLEDVLLPGFGGPKAFADLGRLDETPVVG